MARARVAKATASSVRCWLRANLAWPVTMLATMMHALTTKAVDIVLAVLLLLGSVSGAQIGAQFAQKARPEYLRLALAVIVLLVALRMVLGLGYRPDEIYSITDL